MPRHAGITCRVDYRAIMLNELLAAGYSTEEYEAEIASVQDAFEKAIYSSESVATAALKCLQAAFPSAEFSLKDGALARKTFDDHDRGLLEDVMRILLVRMTSEAVSQSQPIMQYKGPAGNSASPVMERFLQLIKWMAQASTLEAATGSSSTKVVDLAGYCKLLEDLLELGTISDCQDVFACMEADLEFLSSESLPQQQPQMVAPGQQAKAPAMHAAQLTILRACNSLLRRLSKANDVQLCGRILIFIARLYPLTDKSGLNLHGAINAGLPLPIDEVRPEDLDVVAQPVDGRLYTTFWGLQNAFKNPAQLLQPAAWGKFKEDLGAVLDAFNTLPITVPATGLASAAEASYSMTTASQGPAAMDVDGAAAAAGTSGTSGSSMAASSLNRDAATSVKFLTSSKLFGLQMRDGTFRRHFLVQCAAAVHFMSHPTSKDKAAVTTTKFEGLEELTDKVYNALARTEHAGEEFAGAVRGVMERETQWVAWKKEGCPPFERPPDAGQPVPAGTTSAAQQQQARPPKRRRGGPPGAAPPVRLTFAQMIAEPADQMAGLRSAERKNMPNLKEMLTPVIEDMDPEACIEDEYRRKNDKIFFWKATRMLARSSLSNFASSKDLEEACMKVYPEVLQKMLDYKAAEEQRARQEKAEAEAEEQRQRQQKAEAEAEEQRQQKQKQAEAEAEEQRQQQQQQAAAEAEQRRQQEEAEKQKEVAEKEAAEKEAAVKLEQGAAGEKPGEAEGLESGNPLEVKHEDGAQAMQSEGPGAGA